MSTRIHRLPSVLPGHRLHQPKTTKPKKHFRLGLLLTVAGLAAAIYWFFFLGPVFAVEKIEILGVEDEGLKRMADRLIGTNIFRLNATVVEQDMKQTYSPVASVRLIRGLPRTVQIKISLREPKLRWQINDRVYVLDAGGEIFGEGEKAEYDTLPRVIDKSGVPLKVGQHIVAPAFIEFVSELSAEIPEIFHRNITSMEITETTFHLDIVLEGDLRLRVTTQRPSREQLESAFAIFSTHADAKVIDVRVARWAYWK